MLGDLIVHGEGAGVGHLMGDGETLPRIQWLRRMALGATVVAMAAAIVRTIETRGRLRQPRGWPVAVSRGEGDGGIDMGGIVRRTALTRHGPVLEAVGQTIGPVAVVGGLRAGAIRRWPGEGGVAGSGRRCTCRSDVWVVPSIVFPACWLGVYAVGAVLGWT